MSNVPDFVQGIQMPNMKKKTGVPIDIMRPGNGTPWEDRGSIGAVGAYFKTTGRSLVSPALLMDHIKRPETTTDSRSYAIVCAVMWMIGIAIYNIYWFQFVLANPKGPYDQDPDGSMYYWISMVVQMAIVGGGIFLWLTVGPRLFRTLGANELKQAQPSLISNCFNYAMGPSIFAIVPVFGWTIAIIWILADTMIAAKRRLFMKASGSVINVIILAVIGVAIAVVVWLLYHYIWGSLLSLNGYVVKPPPPKIVIPGRPE